MDRTIFEAVKNLETSYRERIQLLGNVPGRAIESQQRATSTWSNALQALYEKAMPMQDKALQDKALGDKAPACFEYLNMRTISQGSTSTHPTVLSLSENLEKGVTDCRILTH